MLVLVMCSIIGVGERLHKVWGQTGKTPDLTLAHWTQVSDRCPLVFIRSSSNLQVTSHKISDEFKMWPHLSIDFGITCL